MKLIYFPDRKYYRITKDCDECEIKFYCFMNNKDCTEYYDFHAPKSLESLQHLRNVFLDDDLNSLSTGMPEPINKLNFIKSMQLMLAINLVDETQYQKMVDNLSKITFTYSEYYNVS